MGGSDQLDESYGGALDQTRLHPLMKRTSLPGYKRLASHGVLIVATGWVISSLQGTWWLIPALIAHGGVLILLFCGLHETVHRTAFRSRLLNDAVATAIGFLVFVPAIHFRAFHMDHHRFTQHPGRDPELAIAKPKTLTAYILLVSGIPFLGDQIRGIGARAAGRLTDSFVTSGARARMVVEARIHGALYTAAALLIVAGWTPPLIYWVVPVLLGQPFLRLVLLAEHTGCALSDDMHINTRTTNTNVFVRFVMWNMSYHSEHHLYPGVPFYALPNVYSAMTETRDITALGYVKFHVDYVRALLAGRGAAFVDATIEGPSSA